VQSRVDEGEEREAAEARIKREELERKLDEALKMSFPASDPISVGLDDR